MRCTSLRFTYLLNITRPRLLTDLIEMLFKLGRIIIDVIDIDGDVSSCCVPTVEHLHRQHHT